MARILSSAWTVSGTFPQADIGANSSANLTRMLSPYCPKSRGIHVRWFRGYKNMDLLLTTGIVREMPVFPRCQAAFAELVPSDILCVSAHSSLPGIILESHGLPLQQTRVYAYTT